MKVQGKGSIIKQHQGYVRNNHLKFLDDFEEYEMGLVMFGLTIYYAKFEHLFFHLEKTLRSPSLFFCFIDRENQCPFVDWVI